MKVLVFQHLAVEHPGSFRDFWRERGVEVVTVELDEGEPIPPLEDFDMLAVMGGPMDVWEEDQHPWLVAEKAAIRAFVRDLRRPYLGICLGHQLLAVALGGEAARMSAPEVGLARVALTKAGRADPLFTGLPDEIETFQWHGVEVTRLPEHGVALASNGAASIQAMRVGRYAYGLQFHPEIVDETVRDWERVPEYWASLVKSLGRDGAKGLAGLVTPRLAALRETAGVIDRNLAAVTAKPGDA